jgi:hypothetical protein
MQGLLTAAQNSEYQSALFDVFWTFARPMQVYLLPNIAVVSTSPTFSRFGDHSQNAPVTADNSAVTPVTYTITGCVLYNNKQPWEYLNVTDAQDKIRQSQGIVRIKVEASGNALFQQVKNLSIDGFQFTFDSNARPHGLVGNPDRWTYTARKVD